MKEGTRSKKVYRIFLPRQAGRLKIAWQKRRDAFPPSVFLQSRIACRGGRKKEGEKKEKNSSSVLFTEECMEERSTRGCSISLILGIPLTAIVSRGNRFVTKK